MDEIKPSDFLWSKIQGIPRGEAQEYFAEVILKLVPDTSYGNRLVIDAMESAINELSKTKGGLSTMNKIIWEMFADGEEKECR